MMPTHENIDYESSLCAGDRGDLLLAVHLCSMGLAAGMPRLSIMDNRSSINRMSGGTTLCTE